MSELKLRPPKRRKRCERDSKSGVCRLALRAQESALKQMVNGTVEVLASRFRPFPRGAPHQELPAMAGRHFLKRFARFRMFCERFAKIGGDGNSAWREINLKFDPDRISGVSVGRLPLSRVDLHAVASAASGDESGSRALAAHDGDDGNVFRLRVLPAF